MSVEELPDFVFLGYRVKRPWNPGPGWAPIELVCCVGDLCEPPDGWVQRWDFNRACCYDTPEAAWATVSENHAAYRLFAYYALPVCLSKGEPPTLSRLDEIFAADLPDLPAAPTRLTGLKKIGYDVAECQAKYLAFPYSPLVNNGYAHEFPTNRYGLLDDLEVAMRACEVINVEMPEHAPHWVIRVFAADVDSLISDGVDAAG